MASPTIPESPTNPRRILFEGRPSAQIVHTRPTSIYVPVVQEFRSLSPMQHLRGEGHMSGANARNNDSTVVRDALGMTNKHAIAATTRAETERPAQVTKAPHMGKGFSTERDPMSSAEEMYDVIKLLKSRTEESIAQLKANVEAKFGTVEHRWVISTESHSNLVARVHTLEKHQVENQQVTATTGSRLSVIEERIAGNHFAEVYRLIDQNHVKHNKDAANLTANLENKLHEFGERLSQVSAHRAAHEEGMASLKDALTSQLADIEERLHTLSVATDSKIANFHFILHRMEARLREDRVNRAQLDVNPISACTDINYEFPEHEGAACGVALRLAAKALADAVDLQVPVETMVGLYGSAADSAPKDAALSKEDACTDLEHELGEAAHGTVNQHFEELAPLDRDLITRTCFPIAE